MRISDWSSDVCSSDLFLRLAEHLNTTNTAMMSLLQRVSAHGAAVFGDPGRADEASLRLLWSLTYREAQTMTYADAFAAIAVCLAVATAMVPLMRDRKSTRLNSSH